MQCGCITKMTYWIIVTVLYCAVKASNGHSVVDNYSSCRRVEKRPLNNCFRDMVSNIATHFTKPISELGVARMDPVFVNELDVSMVVGEVIDVKLKTIKTNVRGFSKWIPKSTVFDPTTGQMIIEIRVPQVRLSGLYSLKGQMLGIQMNGSSTYYLIFNNMISIYVMNLKYNEKLGYTELQGSSLNYTVEGGRVRLNNLGGGDLLGDTVNLLLNQNFQLLVRLMEPTFATRFSQYIDSMYNSLFKHLPKQLGKELSIQT